MIKKKIIIIASAVAIYCVSIIFYNREHNGDDNLTSDSNEIEKHTNTDRTSTQSEKASDDFRTTFTSLSDEREPNIIFDSNEAKEVEDFDYTDKYSEEVSDDFRTTLTTLSDEREPDVKIK
ncbi:hypothetical protein [Enterococcus ureasiticus]|uniref:Uncharacterized protein n=1 Tax=Enterococcus ureasiticus TaxID=903984 RepID=A0A1E5GA64_9ENTE|nr:hypothetical protein [Enterococcus ureasiticus]OEG09583.1 hypothetical protein BCR21_14650 [Enterococcus ureasiticus]